MDTRNEIREFLTTRRARITPDQAGLRTYGTGPRRVAGLRREEVALLAGVSVDYYTRLERGNLAGASDSVLDAVARALQLDDAERAHLFDLARAQPSTGRPRRRPAPQRVRANVHQMLDAFSTPAYIRNGRMDILAANPLGRALYAPIFDSARRPPNSARFAFLDRRAREFFRDWEKTADDAVAVLHGEAGRNPYDHDLTELIGELSTQSEDFRVRWARHDVRYHDTGVKRIHHPVVGDLDLGYEVMKLAADELTMFVYTAEAGSRSAESLNLLASWAATTESEADATETASRRQD
jgi:transcriptional regulator with XRE-family HTH domain